LSTGSRSFAAKIRSFKDRVFRSRLVKGKAERHLVTIERKGCRIDVSCLESMILEHQNETYSRIAGVLALVANAPLNSFRAVADISDGEDSAPGLLSFCSRDPRAILIPDYQFVTSRGYEDYRELANAGRMKWSECGDRIVWRGSTTGIGKISTDNLSADDPDLLLRVRLCLRLKGIPGCDAKISGIAQSSNPAQDEQRLARAGIVGEYIWPLAWHTFKFAIDVDGNSNAWTNFFTRLIMGCCVLKVASPLGFRQWYYSDLEAWTHYVPVRPDLSDLEDQIVWCRNNANECSAIAANGQAFAVARSYDAEIDSGVRRLAKAFKDGMLRPDLVR
jgi:Glycosyl transferase family 90